MFGQVVLAAELCYPGLPLELLLKQFVDAIVELSDLVLTERAVLDLAYLARDLLYNCAAPILTLGHILDIGRVVWSLSALVRTTRRHFLLVDLPLHLDPAIEHRHGFLFVTCH